MVLTMLFSISIGGAFHYCGGNLSQFKLLAGNTHLGCVMSECNQNMGNELASNCCENILVKMDVDDYQGSLKPETSVSELLIFNNIATKILITGIKTTLSRNYFYKHPPDKLFSVDLRLIQVFLI